MGGASYRRAGVDIEKGEEFVRHIKKLFPASGREGVDAFGSLFRLKPYLKKYRDPYLVSSADGVGTKLMIAQLCDQHRQVGTDLVAMNVNDVVALGAQPLFFLDYIACGKLNIDVLGRVMQGIRDGLREAGCELAGGETAEMPDMYSAGEYDLAGCCVGIADRKGLIHGRRISSGDAVIGLASSGIHSNGYSLVRRVYDRNELKRRARALLVPTRIYVKPVLSLLRSRAVSSLAVKGIAHVTGGAFSTKAVKILPPGLALALDKRSWPVPRIFREIQAKGEIAEEEMYSVFNMGIGMILVVKKNAVRACRRGKGPYRHSGG